MTTKNISITNEVYGLLVSLKRTDESFSDELRRLATTKGSLLDFAGAWKDIPDEKIERMKARISERRTDRSRLDELHAKISRG